MTPIPKFYYIHKCWKKGIRYKPVLKEGILSQSIIMFCGNDTWIPKISQKS